MEIVINRMTLPHLLQIKEELVTEFDDFWTYSIFEKELENPNSEYFVAIIDGKIVGFTGILKVLY